MNDKNFNLENTYLNLPACFYEKIKPTLVQNPIVICFNEGLAKTLNLEFFSIGELVVILVCKINLFLKIGNGLHAKKIKNNITNVNLIIRYDFILDYRVLRI